MHCKSYDDDDDDDVSLYVVYSEGQSTSANSIHQLDDCQNETVELCQELKLSLNSHTSAVLPQVIIDELYVTLFRYFYRYQLFFMVLRCRLL